MKLLLIFLFATMHYCTLEASANKLNLEKSLISFADLHNLQPLNCTPSIPSKVVALMSSYSTSVASNSSEFDQIIPAEYLIKCLLNADYDSRISAFYYMQTPTLNVNFALNEIISLEFEGTLSSAVSLTFQWTEARLTWNVASDIPHWNWPSLVDINPSKLWLPVFFVHNCPTTSCAIPIDNHTEIDISNDGAIKYSIMTLIRSTCGLILDLFPFDQQKCNITLDLDNSIPFNYSIVTQNFGVALYYETCDEWLVTAIDFNSEADEVYAFTMNTTSTNWSVIPEHSNNLIVDVHLTLIRTSSSDVYNLLAPVS